MENTALAVLVSFSSPLEVELSPVEVEVAVMDGMEQGWPN